MNFVKKITLLGILLLGTNVQSMRMAGKLRTLARATVARAGTATKTSLLRISHLSAKKKTLGLATGIIGLGALTSRAYAQSNHIDYDMGREKLPGTPNEPETVFAHGLGANKYQGSLYKWYPHQPNGFIEGPLEIFNFKDHANPLISCLGQDADMQSLHEACKDKPKAILVGCSRGAATVANYLGHYRPNNISAAVLESPFDQVPSVINHVIGKFSWIPGGSWLAHKVMNWVQCTGYNPHGIQPIKAAPTIPKDIPVLIVCSKQDDLIPDMSTITLYAAMKRAGHKKVYLLRVDNGAHAQIFWGKDGAMYRDVVHAFYKAHNLPYNSTYAAAGQARFKLCQP